MGNTKQYMAIGRPEGGENEPFLVEADSFKSAAEEAARTILDMQDSDWNSEIFVDVVTDKDFNYEMNFSYEADELR